MINATESPIGLVNSTNTPPYYVQLLKGELNRRKSENRSYSLRSFAAHLTLDPSALSKILKGEKSLSVRASLNVVQRIQFTDQEKRLFLASVAEEKSRAICDMLAMALNPPLTLTHLKNFLSNFEAMEGPSTEAAARG